MAKLNITDNAIDPGMSSGQTEDTTTGATAPITSADLTPTEPIKLPEAPVYDNSDVESKINNFKTESTVDSEIADMKLKANEGSTDISNLIKDIGLTSAQEGSFVEKEGGYAAKKEYDRYASELEAEQLRLRREMDRIKENKEGLFAGAVNQRVADIERQSLSKQADIAILGNAAARRYDTAVAIAKNKVEMLLAPKKAELEGLKYIQENNKAFQTAEFSNLLSRKTNEYNKELENKEKGEVMIVNALQGKAPQTLIDNARKILANGGSYTDVANTLGNYSMSAADRLDLKLKQAQVDKIYNDMNEVSASEKKEIAKLEAEKKVKLPALKSKLDLIQKIAGNKALETLVGPSALARRGIPFFPSTTAIANDFTGRTQSFIGSVNQLVNKEFLDAITSLKSQGGTLGALSEREGQKLSEAATRIGTWEIHEDDDKNKPVIGYNISEEEFINELKTIQDSTRAVYEALGGIVPGSEKEKETLDNYLNAVDSTLLNSDNLYSEAGYN